MYWLVIKPHNMLTQHLKVFILQGGEDITAMELLYFMDGWNLCFGGEISIKENGEFSGRYNTD